MSRMTISRMTTEIRSANTESDAEAILRFAIHRGTWRRIDLAMAFLAIVWGGYVVAPFDAFSANGSFVSLREMASEFYLGGALLISGLVRVAALIINGFWQTSPAARAGAAVISMICWSQILIGFAQSVGWSSTAIPVYSAFAIMDFAAMIAAVKQQRWAWE